MTPNASSHEPTSAIHPKWTVASHYLNSVLLTAVNLGASREKLCSQVGLPLDCGVEPEQRFHMSKLVSLFRVAAKTCNTDDIGLIAGGRMLPQTLGILGLLMQCAKSVGHCFELYIPYRYAMMHAGNTVVTLFDDHVDLTWYPLSTAYVKDRYLVDVFFSSWITVIESVFGVRFAPSKVALTYNEPQDTTLLFENYGCKPDFGQSLNVMTVARDLMSVENPHFNADVTSVLEIHAKTCHDQQQLVFSTSQEVTLAIMELLPKKRATILQVAEVLKTSERTLQRRLTDEGVAFNDILRDLRHRLAVRKLSVPDYSITDVALSLGYGDSSSFTKAFKQWTSYSPSEFRKRSKV